MHTDWMVLVTIHGVDGLHDRVFQILDRLEVIVVDRRSLKVTPQTFNQVQVRSVRRIPDHRHAFTMIFKKLAYALGVRA